MSDHLWHDCEGGKIRTYPRALCSCCPPREDERPDFDPVARIAALQAKLAEAEKKCKHAESAAAEHLRRKRVSNEKCEEYRQRLAEAEAVIAKLPTYEDTGKPFVYGIDEAWDASGNLCSLCDEFDWCPHSHSYVSRHDKSGLFFSTESAAKEARDAT